MLHKSCACVKTFLFTDPADQPTDTGEECDFPFTVGWISVDYYGCTTKDNTVLWCKTASGEANCIYGMVKPFRYTSELTDLSVAMVGR